MLRYCTDDRIRLEAKARLGFHYCETGRKDKGRAIFESLPRENDCREGKLYWALDGEERLSFLRQRVLDGLYLLTWVIDAYAHESENATDEQHIILQNKRVLLFNAVFENGDYGNCHYALAMAYETLARLYLNTGDGGAALSCLQKCAEHAKAFDTLPEEFIHTSPLIDGLTVRRSERQTADSRSLCQIMKEDVFGDERFDALRGDGCFISALNALG